MMQTLAAKQFRKCAIRMLLVFSVVTVAAACGESHGDAELAVRQWVEDVETATTEKARRDLLALISVDYGDNRGNERADIDKMLRAYFLRQNTINLLASIDDLRLIGDGAAEVELTVAMTGQSGGVFGFSADAYRFSLELQTEDKGWRLVAARWGEVGGELR